MHKLLPWPEGLIPQSIVQSEATGGSPAILSIKSVELVAIVEILPGSLIEVIEVPKQEAGKGIVRRIRIERKRARLVVLVIEINLAKLDMHPKGHVVASFHPMDIVGECVVIALERRFR